jgi:hypothetical protein
MTAIGTGTASVTVSNVNPKPFFMIIYGPLFISRRRRTAMTKAGTMFRYTVSGESLPFSREVRFPLVSGSRPERFCLEQRKIVKSLPPLTAGLLQRVGPAGELLVPKPLRNGFDCSFGQTGGENKSDGII